eukprot:jgi/Galph1/5921/GphlegSOOS_G4569.1
MENIESSIEKDILDALIKIAVEAKSKAYVPYLRFCVGACLCTTSNTFYSGCNVENASYGLSVCAERTAVVKAVSEGHLKFRAIAVSTDTISDVWPCGACRQFLSEFGDFPVFLVKQDGSLKVQMVHDLLPLNFSKLDLDNTNGI